MDNEIIVEINPTDEEIIVEKDTIYVTRERN